MTFLDPIPEGAICANCAKAEATIKWVGEGSIMDANHGMYEYWCEPCAVKYQLEYAERIASNIPELQKRLTEIVDE